MSEYQPKEEFANVRRLGEFGAPNLETIYGPAAHPSNYSPEGVQDGDQDKMEAPEKEPLVFNPAIFSLIVMAMGALIIATGVAFVFGIGWGLTTLGVLTFSVGFMTAMNS